MQVINPTPKPMLLSSTAGVSKTLQPDTPTEVDGLLLQLALRQGCRPVDSSGRSAPATVVASDVTDEQIREAIHELIERNDPMTFTSLGKPRVRDVAVVVGAEVSRDQVERVFESMPGKASD